MHTKSIRSLKDGIQDELAGYNASLTTVTQHLNSYLESKRRLFPRFYFLSNDELLQLLTISETAREIQHHLPKCFDAVRKLEFSPDGKYITTVISRLDERLELSPPVEVSMQVEIWLSVLEAAISRQLHVLLKRALISMHMGMSHTSSVAVIRTVQAQVGHSALFILWTQRCEQTLTAKDTRTAHNSNVAIQKAQLRELVEMIQGSLSPLERRKVSSQLTQAVHDRDICQHLRDKAVSSLSDFLWQTKLRMYWGGVMKMTPLCVNPSSCKSMATSIWVPATDLF